MPDTELINQQLDLIAKRIPTCYFMGVVTFDGLIIGLWKQGLTQEQLNIAVLHEEDRIASMSVAMLSLGERISYGLTGGEYQFCILQGTKGTLFNVAFNKEYGLTFGIREFQTIDIVLVILQQWWGELLNLLNVPVPEI